MARIVFFVLFEGLVFLLGEGFVFFPCSCLWPLGLRHELAIFVANRVSWTNPNGSLFSFVSPFVDCARAYVATWAKIFFLAIG